METGGLGVRAAPAPNAGKVVKVRWVKRFSDALNEVCVGEVVRETDWYLVIRGKVLTYRNGSTELDVDPDQENVRWIPWAQIAAVTELPQGLKWRELQFRVDPKGYLILQ